MRLILKQKEIEKHSDFEINTTNLVLYVPPKTSQQLRKTNSKTLKQNNQNIIALAK